MSPLSRWLFWQVSAGKMQTLLFAIRQEVRYLPSDRKSGICHQIGSQVFAIEWHHCECCTSRPWPTFSRSLILKCEYLAKCESWRKILYYDFYTDWYLPSIGTIANVPFRDIELKFQGCIFETLISRKWRATACDFYTGSYSPSNGTIVNVVLRDLDLHFQGQTFSCYAFASTIEQAADVPGRFVSTRTAPAMEFLLLFVRPLLTS